MAHLEHHETCTGLSFVRVLFEFGRNGDVLPCNGLFKRAVLRYKSKFVLLIFANWQSKMDCDVGFDS